MAHYSLVIIKKGHYSLIIIPHPDPHSSIPSGKIDIVLQIKECVTNLPDRGNIISVHWVPGHRDIEGNELADMQAKEAANEIVGQTPKTSLSSQWIKKEAIAEIKKNVKEKWQRKFGSSEKVDQIQEVFSKVGSRNCFGEKDLHNFAMLNQLLAGHTLLNQQRARIDNSVSEMCPVCSVREDPEHFLFYCKAYEGERSNLVKKVESIINSEGLNSVGVINFEGAKWKY